VKIEINTDQNFNKTLRHAKHIKLIYHNYIITLILNISFVKPYRFFCFI